MSAFSRIIGNRGFFGGRIRAMPLWRLALAWLAARLEIQRQRRALARLTPHELKDIGLSPEQARRESREPFWRPYS